jgi:hypothetical protein
MVISLEYIEELTSEGESNSDDHDTEEGVRGEEAHHDGRNS